jgi:hypothetical protein
MQFDWLGQAQREHRRNRRTLLVDAPASRTTDPSTSHQAEARLRKSGELGKRQRQVVEVIARWPGHTGSELGCLMAGEPITKTPSAAAREFRYLVMRRVNEIIPEYARRGQPRECKVTAKPQNVYWPVNRGQTDGNG